jgi:hypothetical protein
MLHFDGKWRFDSPGPIAIGVRSEFRDLINRIVVQGDRKVLLERFKRHFATAAGSPYYTSSDTGWAETDLDTLFALAGDNAPMFIEAFYNACADLGERYPEMGLPEVVRINRVLVENEAGYQIVPPNLISTRDHVVIPVPERTPSLGEQAQEIIHASLQESERLMAEGRLRLAVQEILWLLETVSTAFRGVSTQDGSITGSYFNKIVGDLRAIERGRTLDQVLRWVVALHGYLSAPTGGGVRHGIDLREGVVVDVGEARLYCNLIRSYITFLITEHERLVERGAV